jgi:hypothetical protein
MPSEWFVRRGDKVLGPVDSGKLKSLATSGQINQSTQIAQQAAGPWVNAGTIRGLFGTSPPAVQSPGRATVPPPLMPTQPSTAVATAAKPKPWFRRWYAFFVLYPFLAVMGLGLAIQIVVPKETLERWDAESKERSEKRDAQRQADAKERDQKRAAQQNSKQPNEGTQRIAQHGFQVGFMAASGGLQKPTSDQVDALCRRAAAELEDKATWGFKMVWKDGFWAGWKQGGG